MASGLVYYLWVTLLVVAMMGSWLSILFTIPGNWLNVGLAALFAYFFPADQGRGLHWGTVLAALVLAAIGEAIEVLAGAAGAKRAGASRRSVLLAVVGTMVGSMIGAIVSVPVPIVGPIIGALGGGALGAFAGAYIGETAIGRDANQSFAAGKGALIGRLLGTAGKLVAGVVLIVIVAVDAVL
jgi:uncharacterized protein